MQNLSEPRKHKTGLLLLNLGTPDAPTTAKVRQYLRQFLTDPFVIDIPWIARMLLVYGIILPTRPKKSAEAYQKVWLAEGSPLKVYTETLAQRVGKLLGSDFKVVYGMRYGNPSIEEALKTLADCREILFLPLYPQYSLAATESSVQEFTRVYQDLGLTQPWRIVSRFFYERPGFIEAFAAQGKRALENFQRKYSASPDHFLFSFHGLPERQIQNVQFCYKEQSYETARLIAQSMKIPNEKFSVSFQSRLGRTPWIQPFTDVKLLEFPKKGVKRLLVFSPSFVADCLETLEELEIRGKEDFLKAGGEAFELVPSLNAEPAWASAVADMARSSVRQDSHGKNVQFRVTMPS